MKRRSFITNVIAGVFLGVVGLSVLFGGRAAAAGDFSLQVTPSPIFATVKPGQKTELELKIRNASTQSEELKIEPRSFTLSDNSQQVTLNDTTPPDIANWIHFSAPAFTVPPGGWFSQKVQLLLPKNTGFSYSFALVISRKNNPKPTQGGRLIKGSLAVFTLVNVDQPGATRKLAVSSFVSAKRVYEYLPATLSVAFKNTGNTIVQPYGDIFIQRNANGNGTIGALKVNESKGYILPGSTRTLTSHWTDGFPSHQTTLAADGTEKSKLVWNWGKASSLRIGRYTAKLVAVYNDGQGHDVPIQGTVSFWVLPWKLLAGLLLVLILLGAGVWSFARKLIRLFGRKNRGNKPLARR